MVDISELASKKLYHILMLSVCDSMKLRLGHHLGSMLLATDVLTSCIAVADLPTRVTVLIFLGGVYFTQGSLFINFLLYY